MFFARFLPFLVSIVVSTGLWMWGTALMPVKAAYAALVCSEAVPDREIRERLEKNGFTGVVSESGQRVLLDRFGSIEYVALDEYDTRVLPFDPRNDGYAEKLRSLFVRDNRRFIYIPLGSPAAVRATVIEKRLAAAMGDIPYSLYAAAGYPAGLLLALFCLAVVSLCVIYPLRLAVRSHAAWLIPLLPALAPLALGGAVGFALASFLAGCAILLTGPCLERFTLPRRRGAPPAVCWLLPPLFLIFYITLAFFSGLSPVITLPAFGLFFGLLIFSLRAAYRVDAYESGILRDMPQSRAGRRRFVPVPILSRRSDTFAFSWAMLPFAIAALVLACAGIAMPATGRAVAPLLPPSGSVTEADYYAHCRFQSMFSFTSLHETLEHDGMAVYELAPDGLPAQSSSMETGLSPAGIPPFPLADLVRYLDTAGRGGGMMHSLLFALLPLLFVFPVLFQGRGAGKQQGKSIYITPHSSHRGTANARYTEL